MPEALVIGNASGAVQFIHHPDGVVEARLARPAKRNALSSAALEQLAAATYYFEEMRALVLTSTGPVFSAGVDIAELHGDRRDIEIDRLVHVAADALRNLPIPVIAAVEGPCIGAAIELLLACDGWVFGPDASIHLPSIRMGLVYHPSSLAALQRRLGPDMVKRLVLLQEPLAAGDVLEAVKVVGEPGVARKRALEIASAVAAHPPTLVAATKTLLARLAAGEAPQALYEAHEASFASTERSAAVASALRRRVPSEAH